MRINSALQQLKRNTFNKKLSRIEEEGILNDLELINERLRKKEYKKGFFSINKFDVPSRTRQIYNELEFYSLIGRSWAKIFEKLDIHKFKKIVDLCPGFIPKIELGLFYFKYKGKVIAIDKDIESLKRLEKFLAIFNPKFSLEKKAIDVFRNLEGYEFVTGNHIIDDLILYYFSKKRNINLNELYAKEDRMRDFWGSIEQNREEYLKEIVSVLVDLFKRMIGINGYLCISHYKSYMEKLLDLENAADFAQAAWQKVVEKLCQNGFVEDKKILENYRGYFRKNEIKVLKRIR